MDHKTITYAPNKQNRTKIPRKNTTRSKFISNPSENFYTYVGLLNPPPPPPHSQNKQPPLLPLPTDSPIIHRHHQPLMMWQSLNGRKNKSGDTSSLTTPKKSSKHNPSSEKNMDMFSDDSVFNLSPPPSSLPLPKFSLRSKLIINCNGEKTGVDAGATDNLRRLLRLL
ncbi:hypothetical protein RIF29_13479 [Crotalaria pallida]|uniref:Uncharacterized protein n=1 Tax=Crotalaria pallida TaxID=3830 RepID=A0AAN9IP89_CROPI